MKFYATIVKNKNMKFLHGYIKEQFAGLVKHGMINNTSGIKFHQHVFTPEELRFNNLAAKNTELYNIIKEHNRPFYIDRLQGGWWYYKYNFDEKLVREYMDICDDWMLGFQMHEWASNMESDWHFTTGGKPREKRYYSVEEIERNTTKPTYIPGIMRSFLHSGSPEEYSKIIPPMSVAEADGQYKWMINLRQNENMGMLLPCDSY